VTIQVSAVKAAIVDANADWQAQKNFLTLMSRDERSLYLGYVPGPGEPTLQESERAASAKFREMREAGYNASAAPASFDLRNVAGKSYITAVKNQRNCGSCVAFGSVAAVEGTIRLKRGQPDLAIDLSEAHLFYCHARSEGRNCGNGWWVPPSLNAFRDIGVSDEACYPYTPGDQNCTNLCSDWQKRAVKITGWQEIGAAAGMKEWLSSKGPLAACFTVYDDFYAYRSGVYRHVEGAVAGGHCVCCVGYDDVEKSWICKNSWGDGWGDKGYFRIAYGECGIDARMWGVEVPKQVVEEATWLEKKLITGLWVINEERSAAAYVDGIGWRKISAESDSMFLAMVSALAAAKSSKSPVNLRITNEVIRELYVF
jgi:C1A family cysteine protease